MCALSSCSYACKQISFYYQQIKRVDKYDFFYIAAILNQRIEKVNRRSTAIEHLANWSFSIEILFYLQILNAASSTHHCQTVFKQSMHTMAQNMFFYCYLLQILSTSIKYLFIFVRIFYFTFFLYVCQKSFIT